MPASKAKPECLFDPDWSDAVNEALEALAEQMDSLEEKLNHILDHIHGNTPIIPALEKAVRRNAILVRHVDSQVPDDRVHEPTQPKPKGK